MIERSNIISIVYEIKLTVLYIRFGLSIDQKIENSFKLVSCYNYKKVCCKKYPVRFMWF